jgi:hypothetical protein
LTGGLPSDSLSEMKSSLHLLVVLGNRRQAGSKSRGGRSKSTVRLCSQQRQHSSWPARMGIHPLPGPPKRIGGRSESSQKKFYPPGGGRERGVPTTPVSAGLTIGGFSHDCVFSLRQGMSCGSHSTYLRALGFSGSVLCPPRNRKEIIPWAHRPLAVSLECRALCMTSFEDLAISAVTREYIELDMLFIQAEPLPPTYTSKQLAERVLSQYHLYDRRVILHDVMRQNNFEAVYGPANLGY